MAIEARQVTDQDEDDLALTSNWMRRTSWAATFAGADRHLLSLLDQVPMVNGRDLEPGPYGSAMIYSIVNSQWRKTQFLYRYSE
jgi:hypothetical protein